MAFNSFYSEPTLRSLESDTNVENNTPPTPSDENGS